MTGKEIRRWAWEMSKERRGFLIAVNLIVLPSILLSIWGQRLSWPLRLGVGGPLLLLTNVLRLGGIFVCLHIAKGEETSLRQVFTPFSRAWLGKVLMLVVIHFCISSAITYGMDILIRQGQQIINTSGYLEAMEAQKSNGAFGITREMQLSYMAGSSIKSIGSLLKTLLALFWSIVWFPVDYLLFLAPEKTGKQVIQEGISLGFRSFWKILKFDFWAVYLPAMGFGVITLILVGIRNIIWLLVIAGLLSVYLLLLFWTYAMMAGVGCSLGLLGQMKGGKKKRK